MKHYYNRKLLVQKERVSSIYNICESYILDGGIERNRVGSCFQFIMVRVEEECQGGKSLTERGHL